jgi:hypothetical protein
MVFDPLLALARKPLETEDVSWLLTTIKSGTDAPAAIMGGLFVESALTDAIFANLLGLKEDQRQELIRSSGPLSTFDSKIVMGRALGLLDSPTKHDLTAIRHIRNAFAHGGSRDLMFESAAVSAVCDSLNWLQAAKRYNECPKSAREKYSFVVRVLVTNFLLLSEHPSRPDPNKGDIKAAIHRLHDYATSPGK